MGYGKLLRIVIPGIVVCAAVVSFASHAFAKDIPFEATVDRTRVSLGMAVTLTLNFNGTQTIAAPTLPDMDGFTWRYLGPSTRMSIVNGTVSSSISHIYTLSPVKTGTFTIGPFKVTQGQDTYVSNSLTLEVVQGQVASSPPASSPQALDSRDLNDRAFVVMEITKHKAYVNEPVPLKIKLYVNRLGMRDIQYPTLAHEGISMGEFAKPKQYEDVLNGISYEVIEFDTEIFGLRPGEFKLGPAAIEGNLIVQKARSKRFPSAFDDFFNDSVFDNFFGGYETSPLTLHSADTVVTILPLPQQEKPSDFGGALGHFTMEAGAGPAIVKVGDPVTLKVSIEGEGNFSTVTMPHLAIGSDFKAYDPQIKQEAGKKSFEQILIPLNEAVKEVPEVAFSFFDPQTGSYRTIRKGPFPLKVTAPDTREPSRIIESSVARSAPEPQETLGRDIVYIKDTLGDVQKRGDFLFCNSAFLWIQLVPFFALCVFLGIYARIRKLKTDPRYARRLKAPAQAREGLHQAKMLLAGGKSKEFYDRIFQTLQEYLGNKFQLPSQAITVSIIDEVFKDKTISRDAVAKLKSIFLECDMARFSSSEFSKETMAKTLRAMEETIDYFQRNKL